MIVLEAAATDLEDGMLDGQSVVWTDEDGEELGRGARLVLDGFELGEHTFTVLATDGDDNQVETSVTVKVVESPPPERVEVLDTIELTVSDPVLAAGECQPSTARLQAEFPAGMGPENVRVALNAADLPGELRTMEVGEDGNYVTEVRVSEGDPAGTWQFSVLAETASGEVWSRPAAFEIEECPEEADQQEEVTDLRRFALPVFIGIGALLAIGVVGAGGYLLLRRRSQGT